MEFGDIKPGCPIYSRVKIREKIPGFIFTKLHYCKAPTLLSLHIIHKSNLCAKINSKKFSYIFSTSMKPHNSKKPFEGGQSLRSGVVVTLDRDILILLGAFKI